MLATACVASLPWASSNPSDCTPEAIRTKLGDVRSEDIAARIASMIPRAGTLSGRARMVNWKGLPCSRSACKICAKHLETPQNCGPWHSAPPFCALHSGPVGSL
eukprot:scaffold3964_cov67-Phaeocystis_antarctica.AAC.3